MSFLTTILSSSRCCLISESERITYYYAHLFPDVHKEISERLDQERKPLIES